MFFNGLGTLRASGELSCVLVGYTSGWWLLVAYEYELIWLRSMLAWVGAYLFRSVAMSSISASLLRLLVF